jgi:hypothetical protein
MIPAIYAPNPFQPATSLEPVRFDANHWPNALHRDATMPNSMAPCGSLREVRLTENTDPTLRFGHHMIGDTVAFGRTQTTAASKPTTLWERFMAGWEQLTRAAGLIGPQ